MIWSFDACMKGTWPSANWHGHALHHMRVGQDLRRGFVLVPWLLKGDMEYMANHLHLNHWQSEMPCALCKANRSDMPWNDFTPGAAWKRTLHTDHATWAGARPVLHPLFKAKGYSITMVASDPLHVMDLGVAHHILGNVLWVLLEDNAHVKSAATSRAARLKFLWGLLKAWYTAHGMPCPLNNLTLGMVKAGKVKTAYPELKAKAAETRHMAPGVTGVFQALHDDKNERDTCIMELLKYLCKFYALIGQNTGLALAPTDVPVLREVVDTILVLYTALASQAQGRGERRWNMVPKFHMLWHIGHQANFGNPRLAWTYADEDFVGKMAKLGQACSFGVHSSSMSQSIVRRYMWGLRLRWEHM
jgi:hypothetical protein